VVLLRLDYPVIHFALPLSLLSMIGRRKALLVSIEVFAYQAV
jgi:hypothetical protein